MNIFEISGMKREYMSMKDKIKTNRNKYYIHKPNIIQYNEIYAIQYIKESNNM
jgi:hypothetical protein